MTKAVARSAGILPLVDLAYQGFGNGLDEDASGVRLFARRLAELLVAFSCSKNFGLYCERTGCALALTDNARSAGLTAEHMALVARPLYSMPPDHGSAIVRTILGDEGLAGCWRDELEATRVAIVLKRRQLSAAFRAVSGGRVFDYLEQGTGMFALLKMSRTQIETVRRAHGIYIVEDGRINVAGLPAASDDLGCSLPCRQRKICPAGIVTASVEEHDIAARDAFEPSEHRFAPHLR